MTPTGSRAAARTRLAAACASLLLAFVLANCASQSKKTPPATEPAPAPSQPPPTASTPSQPPATTPGGVPRAGGPITAPWDTAAQSMDARRRHVYPEGESEISRRLLASIPEPGAGRSSESTPPPAPAPKLAPPSDPDSCWDVQILSTGEKSRAERVRDEAEKELGVVAWIKSVEGIHRVRIGGCLNAGGALELANRARDHGYSQAFRVPRWK